MQNSLSEPATSQPLRLSASVAKPKKVVVPLSVGLGWAADPDYIYQEKVDGEFRVAVAIYGHFPLVIAGEYVRATGRFHIFDCLERGGENLRNVPLRDRLEILDGLFPSHATRHPSHCLVGSAYNGGMYLETVLARGGEGVVRKRLASLWGTPMEACKRLEAFYCVVTGINAGQSVQIARLINAEGRMLNAENGGPALPDSSFNLQPSAFAACGSVPLFGGKADRVRIGSILKLEGFGLTAAGKIREPRPCKDTATSWLVKY
jgi:hypothetical protein